MVSQTSASTTDAAKPVVYADVATRIDAVGVAVFLVTEADVVSWAKVATAQAAKAKRDLESMLSLVQWDEINSILWDSR